MIKNIQKIQSNLLFNKVNRLEDNIEKETSYLKVKDQQIELKNEQKIKNLIDTLNSKLTNLEINSKVTLYFESLKTDKIQKLEKNVYWKLRKVKQSFNKDSNATLYENETNKLLDEHDSQLAIIDEEFSSENFLKFLRKRLLIQNKYDENVTFDFDLDSFESEVRKFEENAKELLSELIEKNNVIIDEFRNDLNVKKAQVLEKLEAKAQRNIPKLQQRLLEYNKKLKIQRDFEHADLINKFENAQDQKEKYHLQNILNLYEEGNDDHIVVENLLMQFGGLKAVNDLSFSVKRNEIFGLIGPNGAGKTTVFNCITQFYKPTSGNIYYKNKNDEVFSLNDMKVHDVIKYGIVRTFQNVELIWELSVLDNMLVGAHTSYRSGFFSQLLNLPSIRKEEDITRDKALKVLTDLNLLDYKDSQPVGLPYGVLKRIELARTLMLNPELIILDEPAAGLNETETVELAAIIKKIRDEFKVTIFLVEHDMGLVMDVCDRICAISFGKMLAIGTPEQIQSNKLVQEAYLGGVANE